MLHYLSSHWVEVLGIVTSLTIVFYPLVYSSLKNQESSPWQTSAVLSRRQSCLKFLLLTATFFSSGRSYGYGLHLLNCDANVNDGVRVYLRG